MQLYRWQKECLRAWEQNRYRGIAHVATGAGKTVLALEAIRRLWKQFPEASVKIVVPSIPLANQWKSALMQENLLIGELPGFFGGGKRDSADTRVMVYIVNSARDALSNHIRRELSLGHHVLLICDECHHYASPQNKRIFDFLTPDVLSSGLYTCLGLSATPLQTENDSVLLQSLGQIIYHYSVEHAVQEGILSPFSVCEVAASFSAEEKGEYVRLTVEIGILLQKLYAAQPGLKELNRQRFLQAVAHMANIAPEETAAAFLLRTYRRKEISALASSRVHCCLALLQRLRCDDRVIIFSERISQAEQMAAVIRRTMGSICVLYHSGLTKEARARNMQLFRENSVRVLVSCRCLDEGIDVPDANVGIVLSGSAVRRQQIQRLGRVIRRSPGKAAACLYHIFILEAAEDPAFLPGLSSCEKFSLRYDPAENDFSNDLYEYAGARLLSGAKKQGMSEHALRELRLCLTEGLTRADWLLTPEALEKSLTAAVGTHEKNYARVMAKMHRELSFCESLHLVSD